MFKEQRAMLLDSLCVIHGRSLPDHSAATAIRPDSFEKTSVNATVPQSITDICPIDRRVVILGMH